MITLLLFASALIGQGLGYGIIYPFHPMLVISLKNFKVSNLKAFCLENKSLVFMALYSAASILWSTSARIGVKELAFILMGEAVIFFVAYSDVTSKQLFNVLKIVVCANLFISVGESLNIFRYPFSALSPLAPIFARKFVVVIESVPTGFHFNPNNNALFILMISPIMVTLLHRNWAAIYLLISSFVIFMASSKLILTGWMFFLFVLFFAILIKKIGFKKAFASFISLVLVFGFLFYISSGVRIKKYQRTIPSIFTFVKSTPVLFYSRLRGEEVEIDYEKRDNSLHKRLLLLDGLAKVLGENWIFGVGGGSLETIQHTQKNTTLSLKTPHFYLLELFAKYGILFLGAYLFWLGKLCKNAMKLNILYGLSLFMFVAFSPVMSSAIYFIPKWGLFAFLLKIVKESELGTNAVNEI